MEETSGAKFSVRLDKTRLDKRNIDSVEGRTVEVGAITFPPKSIEDIKYIAYKNRVIYPVYSS